MNATVKGTIIATAVAGLFGCTSSKSEKPSGVTPEGVRCQGINECRGKGECHGPGHPCGKSTPCRGQGWLTVKTADECTKRGGHVIESA